MAAWASEAEVGAWKEAKVKSRMTATAASALRAPRGLESGTPAAALTALGHYNSLSARILHIGVCI
jgi:hypothetical protein